MPQPSRKMALKFSSNPFDKEKRGSQRHSRILLKGKGVRDIKSGIPSFGDSSRPKQHPGLPQQVLGSKLERTRIVGGVLPESKMHFSSGELPTRAVSLLNKKVSSNIVTEALMQKEHEASQFLSLLMGKGRLPRHKEATPPLDRKVGWNAEEATRLSNVQRLELFQALLKEPSPFLELHYRFNVSKQTIKRLVKNGLLTEIWGPKAVGVRFKLTSKGKTYLKELEAAAKYEPKMRKSAIIRLQHRISI